MEIIDKKTIKMNKTLNELDKFVLKFVKILEKYTKYVIVSGYVAILFGRARSTEDIDIIALPLSEEKFYEFWNELEKQGFWCLNATSAEEAFSLLKEGIAIRVAERGQIIPNIELKFSKNSVDETTISERIKVVLSKSEEVYVSPIEMQIAYKELILASEKDLEDALHLREVFRDTVSEEEIERWKRVLEGG